MLLLMIQEHKLYQTNLLYLKLVLLLQELLPIKLTSGTLMSTAENGAFEYDGTHLYFTVGTTRYQLDSMSSNIITANSFVASTAVSTPLIISPANSALAITPNAGYGLNVNLSTTGDFAVILMIYMLIHLLVM